MWRVELDFVTRYEDDAGFNDWDGDDGGHVETFCFDAEDKARAFHDEAKRIIEQGWGEDDNPTPDQLDFVRQHNITLYDLDNQPVGGFLDGKAVGYYTLALVGILTVERYESLTDQWRDECGSAS